VDWLLTEQRTRGLDIFRLPTSVQESPVSLPDNNVERHGRRLNPNFLRAVTIVDRLLGHVECRQERLTVFELGGGLGHVAHVLKTLHPTALYIVVDLPEALFFSYQFLMLTIPTARVLFAAAPDACSAAAIGAADFVFVPTMFANALVAQPFDVFINTASLGEMRNQEIRHWMRFVQERLDVRYCYSLNRYLNVIIPSLHDWRLNENECSLLFDARWSIRSWEVEPAYTRCPYVDTIVARYLEVIGERSAEEPEPIALAARSRELVDEVSQEDWVRIDQTMAPEMSMRGNALAHDLGQQGTLYKLWDSIRYEAVPANVLLMLRYLDRLITRGVWEFEEVDYYERLLSQHVSKN